MDRLIARELMDDENASADDDEWRGSVDDLARVNRLLGGCRLLRNELDRLREYPRSVLDVGTGGGDMPCFVLDYLRSRGVEARCVAVDRSPTMLKVAAERLGDRRGITLQQADATALPFADRSFDLAMMSLALHHFDGAVAVQVLREMARVARVVLINDLRRSRVAWAFARLVFPLFTRNRFTRNDGPISVLRAYTPQEARGLARDAGWSSIAVRKHPGYRMALVGGCA